MQSACILEPLDDYTVLEHKDEVPKDSEGDQLEALAGMSGRLKCSIHTVADDKYKDEV